jgi:secretion/DNA translocation related TadE-like protein
MAAPSAGAGSGYPRRIGTGGRRAGDRERGSVTIVMAAVLMVGCVLVLVSVDLLRVLQAKAEAQTAADAAALAAAQEIAMPTGRTPQQAAGDYAGRNGGTLVACACAPGTTQATVAVRIVTSLVFLGGRRTVLQRARAVIGPSAASIRWARPAGG